MAYISFQPSDEFQAKAFSGNSSTNAITLATGFSPQQVWVKKSDGTSKMYVFDTVRGANYYLSLYETAAQVNDATSLTSFDANGFTNVGTTSTTRIGVGTGGYGTSGQGFWVDGSGRLSLGNKLTWDGSALSIKGTIQLTDGTEITDSGLNWRGAWAHSTAYSINDGVSYAESSYICIVAHNSTNDLDVDLSLIHI